MGSLRPVRGSAEEILALLREWEAADDPAPLVVETSGSTGEPKQVVLSRAAMRASADATHDRLGGSGHWLLLLTPAHVAGLMVLFRSVRAATSVVTSPADLGGGRRYVSVVPTQLRRMLGDPWLRSVDAVLVGGAALDAGLRDEARAQGVPVVTTYGMSETCGGCVYDGRPLDGVEVAVGDDGRVRVRGPVLFDGYEGSAHEGSAHEGSAHEDWFVTQDVGRLVDGRLEVTGRVDDVVVTGGVNVPTTAVAARIREHPAVRQVEVLGVPDAEWGHAVAAVVVGDVDLETLRDWVAAALPRTWAPRALAHVDDVPLLPNGKVDRLALRRLHP